MHNYVESFDYGCAIIIIDLFTRWRATTVNCGPDCWYEFV